MALSSQHYLELYINKQLVELESQDSLNLRINSTLFDPTKTNTTQAEYSFSFDIPSTPNNDKILDYANNLSKINKFHTRYSSQVYADGELIFDGSLTIQKYKGGFYTCNLVNIKVSTLEDIFGEDPLAHVSWLVDFEGARTINEVNADPSKKYWFPLVSYGAFQKQGDNEGFDELSPEDWTYSSKYVIDDTNRFYISSFYPSLNMLEMVRKCFEYKGYSVAGDAYTDKILSNIYCSTNLGDEQQPIYNVGDDKFGKCTINITFTDTTATTYLQQDLKYPYFHVGGVGDSTTTAAGVGQNSKYNFSDIFYKNLFDDSNGDELVYFSRDQNMFNNDGKYILIPADGFYKISLSGATSLLQNNNIEATQWVRKNETRNLNLGFWARKSFLKDKPEESVLSVSPNMRTTMPIEVQLVKNFDDTIELIKGNNNFNIVNGKPQDTTYTDTTLDDEGDISCDECEFPNLISRVSSFPHEALGEYYQDAVAYNATFPITDYGQITDSSYNRSPKYGYISASGEVMAYDPVVSDGFICGWTTMGNLSGGGTTAIIKNGYSWSKSYSDKNNEMYVQNGYYIRETETSSARTKFNYNSLSGAPTNSFTETSSASTVANVSGIVYLKKGDILNLMLVKRGYWKDEQMVTYASNIVANLSIEAATPRDYYAIKDSYTWNSPNEFSTKLNLFNFTSNEKSIAEWLKDVQETFNLEYVFNGTNVDVNINRGIKKTINYAVDIDDRVNSNDAEAEYINYPRTMSVRFKTDTDEHGFYESVPQEHINNPDWKKWGDSGFTIIKLNDDSYETKSQDKNLKFSYCWYDIFRYEKKSTVNNSTQIVTGNCYIPVIQKEEYMIEGYNDYEAQYKRGYQLPQRFWFRTTTPIKDEENQDIELTLRDDWTLSAYSYNLSTVKVYAPTNMLEDFNLSLKDTEKSILTEYWNIHPLLSSNYVTVETFLNPTEYINIKNGAMVKFDSDLYFTSTITGFDPTGGNTTKLKLIKKT